jgi:hypothetical protein
MRTACTFTMAIVAALMPTIASAQTVNLQASDMISKAELFFSPASATFQEHSTFEIPIYINTKGRSVNTVELHVKFDPTRLRVVKPSGGTSIIGYWVGVPSYNNAAGTIDLSGMIPNGISTESGLVFTITFEAVAPGNAAVTILESSRVLMNDGLGTPAQLSFNRGVYSIAPKPPDGVAVFSDTHPFQDHWYNNASPAFAWNKDPGITGFSIALDNTPTTVPEATVNYTDTIKGYTDLGNGVWYFHIRALKNGVWGATTHYAAKIDTSPPASFVPTIDYLTATAVSRFLISFFTTDAVSGIDHYEVGIIDRDATANSSPVFVQAESPFQLPIEQARAHVIVRAFDRAGNVRDGSIDAAMPVLYLKYITDHATVLLVILLVGIILLIIIHFFTGHHVIARMERGFELLHEEEHATHSEHTPTDHVPPPSPTQ